MDQSRENLLKKVNYAEDGLSDAEDPPGETHYNFRGSVVELEDPLGDSEFSYSKVKAERSGSSSSGPTGKRRRPLLRWWYGPEHKPRSPLLRWLYLCLAGTLLVVVILIIAYVQIRRSHTRPHENVRPKKTSPAINRNFQDPSLIKVHDTWYAFAGPNGNPTGENVIVASSPDFSNWTVHEGYDALPILGSWAGHPEGHVWSPEVNRANNGNFVMYYSAVGFSHPMKHCIGAATSPTVTGPYTALNTTLACDLAAGGAIDADAFHDPTSNTHYFVYKVDGNSIGGGGACGNGKFPVARTPIMVQPMDSSDLITPLGEPWPILSNDEIDGPNVEGPKLFYRDGWYYLIFSSGCFADAGYTIRYAVSKDLRMPFRRVTEPLIKTGDLGGAIQSPGCVDMSEDGDRLIFHGDTSMDWFKGKGKRVRSMYAADLEFEKRPGVGLRLGNLY